jgi:hypothetical protein
MQQVVIQISTNDSLHLVHGFLISACIQEELYSGCAAFCGSLQKCSGPEILT